MAGIHRFIFFIYCKQMFYDVMVSHDQVDIQA